MDSAELIRRLIAEADALDTWGAEHECTTLLRTAAAALSTPRVQPIRYSPLAVYDDDRDEWHAEMFTDATGAWVKYADAAPQIPPTPPAPRHTQCGGTIRGPLDVWICTKCGEEVASDDPTFARD